MKTDPILEVTGLSKTYPAGRGTLPFGKAEGVQAVRGISFSVGRGETLALVGESGCGKSTTARMLCRLTGITAGAVNFDGVDVVTARGGQLLKLRRRIQYIFQDPFASLNPRMRVGDILEEPLIIHRLGDRRERKRRIDELFEWVGLPSSHGQRFPHQFSGGQRQRIGIARALAVNPELIICDEPVSALDVSIRAQIINLLLDLQEEFGLSYLMISHDLSVVEHMSDRVAVMFFGQIVETGPWSAIFSDPVHPYTRRLIATIPDPGAVLGLGREVAAEGPAQAPAGWSFADDGSSAPDVTQEPKPSELVEVAPGHFVRLSRS